ncbi:MAG TPA: hypothetical protein VN673_07880 [Clostridia bacterium]|nr:hypothetical protein [Clostridia bacterium]
MTLSLKLLAPLLVCLSLVAGCKKATPAQGDVLDYGSDRDAVVQAVKSGQLKPNAAGVISLPDNLKSASINGQVYSGNDGSGGFLLAFPLMQASGRMECMLYADKALAPGPLQVGSVTFNLSGRSQGKWYQANVAMRR